VALCTCSLGWSCRRRAKEGVKVAFCFLYTVKEAMFFESKREEKCNPRKIIVYGDGEGVDSIKNVSQVVKIRKSDC
jgi:hypothetical protein